MPIAYLINQYPKVSHSFIRREIQALERHGVDIERIAVRGWDAELVDAEDLAEQRRTRYILKDGMGALLGAVLRTALTRPARLFAALRLALAMGRRADRPLPYHLIYLAEACRMLPWLAATGCTHVHAHFGTNSAEVAMLVQALGGPRYSFTVHGPEEFDKPGPLHLGTKLERAAFAVAVSSYGRSQLFRWVGHRHWPRIQEVHCGIEQAFHAVPPTAPPAAPRLVCVGRLCEQKGQLLLLQALRQLADRGRSCELVLAGDGEMRADIEAEIRALGLSELVRVTGWIDSAQVRAEILAARALVLPSFAEGLPVVIMEAMALRRPVLSTYVAGIPELVRPGRNGWLVPAGAVEQLADAMEACLDTPAERLREMGEAAYHDVLARHDVDHEAARLAALFGAQAT